MPAVEQVVVSERLDLEALDAADLEALLDGATTLRGITLGDGWPLVDLGEAVMCRFFLGRVREDPSLGPWR